MTYSTIILPLVGPLQSWGQSGKWTERDSAPVPTKSGVIGLIANAMGLQREDSLDRFNGIRFGVRVDQPGKLLIDFQTVDRSFPGKPDDKATVLQHKMYLMDASFTVGLEGSTELIQQMAVALMKPQGGALFLGRRSCPPSAPIIPTIYSTGLEDALQSAPSLNSEPIENMAIEIEPKTPDKEATWVGDEPMSFNPKNRSWRLRPVVRMARQSNPFMTAMEAF